MAIETLKQLGVGIVGKVVVAEARGTSRVEVLVRELQSNFESI